MLGAPLDGHSENADKHLLAGVDRLMEEDSLGWEALVQLRTGEAGLCTQDSMSEAHSLK